MQEPKTLADRLGAIGFKPFDGGKIVVGGLTAEAIDGNKIAAGPVNPEMAAHINPEAADEEEGEQSAEDGKPWSSVPWVCPVCGRAQSAFIIMCGPVGRVVEQCIGCGATSAVSLAVSVRGALPASPRRVDHG